MASVEVVTVSRIRLGVSALFIAALATVAGGQDPKKDPPKDPPKEAPKEAPKAQPTPPADPNAKRFEPKFEKDKSFFQEMNTSVTQVIKVQGQDLTQKQDSTFFFKWTPKKLENEKWYVEQEVEGLRMTIDITGNVITYDSTKPDASVTAGNPNLTEFFKKLVGAKFTVVIDAKTFRVVEVQGRDQFIASLGAGSQQMDTLLKNIMTDDAVKQMADPTFGIVPDAPKKPGESWTRDTTINLGPIGSYTVKYTFKYVGPGEGDKKDKDKIEVETTLVYNAPKTAPDGLLFRIKEGKLNSEGPAKGVIYFDSKAGRIDSAEIAIKLKGDLVVTIGGTDTKVELNQEQKTTIKTSDTSYVAPKK
jgi:hypothetical protein